MPEKILVQTEKQLDDLLERMWAADIVGLDTETNGKFSRYEVSLVGISVGLDDLAAYIPLTHIIGDQLELPFTLLRFKDFLEATTSRYVFHNAKFDEMVFKVHGINCQGSGDDTMVMAWLLKEEGRHGLKGLVKDIFDFEMETYEEVVSKRPRKRGEKPDYNFAAVSLEDALSYAADDAYYTLKLYRLFKRELEKQDLWDAYERIERPLLRVVRDMEDRGLLVDQKALGLAKERFPAIMEKLEEEILEDIGQPINIDSGKQLGTALFDILKIDEDAETTATGQYKTDKKALEKYKNVPVVEKVLHRKKIKKTNDVFVEGLEKFIDHGRVHAQFHSTGTVSGRFSSSKPNVQQIQGDEIEEIKVRDFFIPADGNTFVIGDFGQIELRVMAHLAKDEAAIAAFNSGRDFHTETARIMYHLSTDIEPTTRQRFYAKSLNFGIPYGRGPTSVGEVLGIRACCCGSTDRNEDGWIIHESGCWGAHCGDCASCYIEKWFEGFPQVGPYKDETVKKARERGYIRTLAGRKRRLPNLNSPSRKIRSMAERQAFNTVCQGGAADIIKAGMVAADPKLKKLGAHLLIQVHDELLTECPIECAEEVRDTLQEVMEHPINGKNPLRLPLKFEPKIVSRWSQAK